MFYQKVTDIFVECSIDYDKNSNIAKDFYATIQNKFHFAITGHTAAEIIYDRANASKDNMGLTTWENSPNGKILKSDVVIAKNYLDEKEIKNSNNLVNLFLDIAEKTTYAKKPATISKISLSKSPHEIYEQAMTVKTIPIVGTSPTNASFN